MFSQDQAALLSIQLLIMCHVFAEVHQVDFADILVSEGDAIVFTCNMTNAKQIIWTKGRLLFTFKVLNNQTFSNVTSQRMSIDSNFPSRLNILDVQHEDAGLYKCEVIYEKGVRITEWNLTVGDGVLEISKEISSWSYCLYILTPVIGLLLCGLAAAVCLCRKLRTTTSNQDPVPDQFPLQSGGEVVPPQLQGDVDRRTNNKQRSQYLERLNSIYGI
ncbi:uncharacterized protein LOC122992237 isoform X2 [Thunnus albacares]|uniref:uncharacterized protein LOC122992237 isoform X2 n=1 Tax=Thunnus albacares TaxID=8236 RepID=UPI001CF71A6D|nr:uncharacterized protein LOC122992237 isoform X2 [Thunnus albacares]